MNAVRVPWSSASFLVYLGGITILFATIALLDFAASHGLGLVLWAAITFGAITALARLARNTGHFVTAGLLAVSSVAAFVVLLGALLDWFGWLPDTGGYFHGFRFWVLVVELAAVVASAVALRIFKFPLLVFFVAGSSWFFVTDLLSNGGDWSAIVTIVVGLVLLLAGIAIDNGASRPYGFWLHVSAGLTIGGGLVWFFHESTVDWIVIGVVGLAYIAFGDRVIRSSWAVLGAWGILQTASYFADKWSDVPNFFFHNLFFPLYFLFPFASSSNFASHSVHKHNWIGPLIYGLFGLVFIGIALLLARKRRDATPAAALI